MATTTIPYPTKQGDSWDKIAYEVYGDAFRIKELIDANPDLEIKQLFREGEIVNVPVLQDTTVLDQDLLPPWKRDAS